MPRALAILLVAAAFCAHNSHARAQSAAEVTARVKAYVDAVAAARTRYLGLANEPPSNTRAKACANYGLARAKRDTLDQTLSSLQQSSIVPIVTKNLVLHDKDLLDIGLGLKASGGCTSGGSRSAGSRSGTGASPPTLGSASTHKRPQAAQAPLYLVWEGDPGKRSFFLEDDKGRRVPMRPSLYREIVRESRAESQPTIIGEVNPETAARDVSELVRTLGSSPTKLEDALRSRLTLEETVILTESAYPMLNPAQKQELKTLVGSVKKQRNDELNAHRTASDRDAADEQYVVQNWLDELGKRSASADTYRALLAGQELDLTVTENNRQLMLQVLPTTKVEVVDHDTLEIGGRAVELKALKGAKIE